MTTFREDHEQQVASATAERNMNLAKANLERMIQDRRLKREDLPGKTILKTHLLYNRMVQVMDTGHFFSVEIHDGYYDESASLDECYLPIDVAWQVGVITDDEGDTYALLKSEYQAVTKKARDANEIHQLISKMGADKVREALG
jgi:hypothetical protein